MIARLGVLLGLDTAEFNKGLADAGKKLDEFVAHAQRGAAIAATAFVGMTVKAMQYADEIADVAKANDIAIDSVIKLQNALANSGGSAENAGKLLSSFSSYVDKAAEGSFEAQKLFSKLGVSFQDLGKLSTEELFNKTVKGIAAIEDPLTRAAKGMEVFGKAAKGVDFVGMAEGIESATQATEQQADAIKVMADLYDSIAQAARDFQLTFIEAVAPSIKATIDYIKELKDGGADFGGAIRIALETILVLGANVVYVFKEIAEGIKLTFQQAWALATLDFKEFGRAFDESQEKTRKNLEALQNFERRVMRDAGGGRGFVNPELVRGSDSPGRATTVGRDKDAEKAEKERLKELQERMRTNAKPAG